jgi:hypothetical protein
MSEVRELTGRYGPTARPGTVTGFPGPMPSPWTGPGMLVHHAAVVLAAADALPVRRDA